MKKYQLLIAMTTIILIGTVTFIATRDNEPKKVHETTNDSTEKIDVLVSILPQKEIVKSVGGDLVSVTELVHPGESPAT